MIEILSQSSVDKILGTPKYIRSYHYKHDSKISDIIAGVLYFVIETSLQINNKKNCMAILMHSCY